MDHSESRIISDCQNGNLSGFSILYNRYIEKIYNYAFYRVLHKETAEDISSKVFLKALKKINYYSAEQGSFSAWLYKITKNEIVDYYRAIKPSEQIESCFDLKHNEDLFKKIGASLELDEIKIYLEKISREQREILIMRIWDGLSHKEIAEITGKTEENCKVIFSRTIRKLREEMPIGVFLAFMLRLF